MVWVTPLQASSNQAMSFSELEEIWIFGNTEEIGIWEMWRKLGFGKCGGFAFCPAPNLCSEGDRQELQTPLAMLVLWK